MALTIEMFSDFICPFCYIGFRAIRQLQPEFDLQLRWRGFQIHPEWPAEGIAADKLRLGTDGDARRAAWQRITALAESVGLAIKPPAVLANSRAALMAAELAIDKGRGVEFEERVYSAYFCDGANIGDVKVLRRLGEEVGLDRGEIVAAATSPIYQQRLRDAAYDAGQRDVSGVPTFFIGEYPLVGAQNLDVMRRILRRASERLAAGR